jgi:hypothetical protein
MRFDRLKQRPRNGDRGFWISATTGERLRPDGMNAVDVESLQGIGRNLVAGCGVPPLKAIHQWRESPADDRPPLRKVPASCLI